MCPNPAWHLATATCDFPSFYWSLASIRCLPIAVLNTLRSPPRKSQLHLSSPLCMNGFDSPHGAARDRDAGRAGKNEHQCDEQGKRSIDLLREFREITDIHLSKR